MTMESEHMVLDAIKSLANGAKGPAIATTFKKVEDNLDVQAVYHRLNTVAMETSYQRFIPRMMHARVILGAIACRDHP